MGADGFYHAESRRLQDDFDSRRARRPAGGGDAAGGLQRRRPGVHRGRARSSSSRPPTPRAGRTARSRAALPGFVRVTGPSELAFPDYDGNGMFRSLGNILVNPAVGLLFIEMGEQPAPAARERRGEARARRPAAGRLHRRPAPRARGGAGDLPELPALHPAADGPSVYAPRAGEPPVEPAWKSSGLPRRGSAARSDAGAVRAPPPFVGRGLRGRMPRWPLPWCWLGPRQRRPNRRWRGTHPPPAVAGGRARRVPSPPRPILDGHRRLRARLRRRQAEAAMAGRLAARSRSFPAARPAWAARRRGCSRPRARRSRSSTAMPRPAARDRRRDPGRRRRGRALRRPTSRTRRRSSAAVAGVERALRPGDGALQSRRHDRHQAVPRDHASRSGTGCTRSTCARCS